MVAQLQAKFRRKAVRRRATRIGFWVANCLLLALVLFFVLNTHSGNANSQSLLSSPDQTQNINPLDQVSSADIAVTVARMSGLAEQTAITNTADSEDVAVASAPTTNSVVMKPQVVATAFKSNKDIQVYKTQKGDTIASIAAKFHVSSNSIKWSNNLSSITAGVKLYIPPVNGIVYVVKKGDTPSSLASKYSASKSQIIAYNDAELTGQLKVGERIIIPDGRQQAATSSYAYSGAYGGFLGGSAQYGYNGYDYGYCTWWVAQRRAQVGMPLPSNLGNASTWGYLARAYGLDTGSTPRKYAAAVTSTVGEGHVVFVEAVYSDGSILISEMNHLGWAVKDTQHMSAAEASHFIYIY